MREEEFKIMKDQYENIKVPDQARKLMEEKINQAKIDKKKEEEMKKEIKEKMEKRSKFGVYKKAGLGMAAMFAAAFISVNASGDIAYAMGNVPVLGKVFQVMTVRQYDWQSEDGKQELTAELPVISEEENGKQDGAVAQVNKSTEDYINALMDQFKTDMEDYEGGYDSLDVSYDVLTDDENYFSLDIAAVETAGSGYEFHKYYTIDKKADKVLALSDLYEEGYDYVTEISKEIIRQMEADKDTPYFIGEQEEGFTGFEQIKEDQNFYINKDGKLVIAFDEYEVGPGYIGAPQFVVE